ncbi:MAG TPA: biotin--[acetyl-CoA-carboxylase] ligase [Terriglobia bacterium]|nr:biotin--[acetyl-CoA-carboxylase] ligase [Terriglobia bacterium]
MGAAATDRRMDKLISVLVKNATVVLPGPKIASQIGVTRSTVWKYVGKLRALGVDIQGHTSSGYQLRTLPDILAPSLIQPELGDNEIGRKIIHYFRIDSTNNTALALATDGAADGTVVLAEEQTAGRGRFGRKWYSEKSSGIYASVILRPKLSPADAPALTLMAGVAAHRAVSTATGLEVDIRWPNDLLVNGKKVCGILTEMNAELGRLHHVVLGIGVNVNNRTMPSELGAIATSLRMEGKRSYSRTQIALSLLKELERYYGLLKDEGNAPIVRAWAKASTFAEGKTVRVRTSDEDFQAVTAGLDPTGMLRIRREDGREELLVSGEITEVRR